MIETSNLGLVGPVEVVTFVLFHDDQTDITTGILHYFDRNRHHRDEFLYSVKQNLPLASDLVHLIVLYTFTYQHNLENYVAYLIRIEYELGGRVGKRQDLAKGFQVLPDNPFQAITGVSDAIFQLSCYLIAANFGMRLCDFLLEDVTTGQN
ncbi:hypothetical protein BDD12DRAFT_346352 [Trichophaea hybrida]|nr:hypothetical protein BDD12DRAFT_346352 [Trichophaea hybrida]